MQDEHKEPPEDDPEFVEGLNVGDEDDVGPFEEAEPEFSGIPGFDDDDPDDLDEGQVELEFGELVESAEFDNPWDEALLGFSEGEAESAESETPLDPDLAIPPPFFASRIDPENDRQIEVRVLGVFEHSEASEGVARQRFVLVSDSKGRKVPILIGAFEALSISMAAENEAPGRPLSHDLIKTLIEKFEATVDRILIDDLWHDVFYAKLYITKNGTTLEIDSRPSDAIAIALRFRAPIFMSENVLEATSQE